MICTEQCKKAKEQSEMNRASWIVQGLLAALFLFGGIVKLTMPAEDPGP